METITYQIQPKDESNIQELAKEGELISLREELGLDPLKLKDKNSDLFRFRKITEEEHNIYSVLFPQKAAINDYDQFIPLDVLSALKEFKETCPYRIVDDKFTVWHAKDYDPDPILTASVRTENDEYSFANAVFLIARWGEALKPFEELKEIAFKKWKNARLHNLKSTVRKINNLIEETEGCEFITNKDVDLQVYGMGI